MFRHHGYFVTVFFLHFMFAEGKRLIYVLSAWVPLIFGSVSSISYSLIAQSLAFFCRKFQNYIKILQIKISLIKIKTFSGLKLWVRVSDRRIFDKNYFTVGFKRTNLQTESTAHGNPVQAAQADYGQSRLCRVAFDVNTVRRGYNNTQAASSVVWNPRNRFKLVNFYIDGLRFHFFSIIHRCLIYTWGLIDQFICWLKLCL